MSAVRPLTLEQHRIQLAYQTARAFLTTAGDPQDPKLRRLAWKTVIMGFGTSVMRCGLCQALAFVLRDKAKSVGERLFPEMRKHLVERGFLPPQANTDLFIAVSELPAPDYMLVSREVLALAIWLRRATQALCDDQTNPPGGADARAVG